jgi:hypothetical protein
MLEEGKAISKIAKKVNITTQRVYRIKHDRGDYLDKLVVNANEGLSQCLKTHKI